MFLKCSVSCVIVIAISLAEPQGLGCEAPNLFQAVHGEVMRRSGTIPLSYPISVQ